jgi:soluble lytic murein transglycosylase-like protein
MMAICLAETSAGKVNYGDKQLLKKGIKKGSYGVMQVRLSTARFVAKHFKLLDVNAMSDVTLIKKMMKESPFNAKIATLYVVWLSEHSKSYFEMVSRYNGGKVNHPYFNKIKKHLAFLKRYKL